MKSIKIEAMHYDKDAKIYVAGHRGLVGSAICRELKKQGYTNILTRTHQELDLEDAKKTRAFIGDEKPDVIFLAAAKVGGIHANNTYPVDFLMQNMAIQMNVIKSAHEAKVDRLFFLGSSCIYPKNSPQPIKEEYLLTSELEPTNRPYALAKIAGIEICWSYNRQFGSKFLAVMPTNLYGPGDNYDPENSHVLPALIRKIHEAKEANDQTVTIWGTGTPQREFLYSDDLANALLHLMHLDDDTYNLLVDPSNCPIINIGSGIDFKIIELADKVKKVIGFEGDFAFDTTKPDGTPRKLMDSTKINQLGWKSKVCLDEGIKRAYLDFLDRNG
jgi:GDP-L-fucose synthase